MQNFAYSAPAIRAALQDTIGHLREGRFICFVKVVGIHDLETQAYACVAVGVVGAIQQVALPGPQI